MRERIDAVVEEVLRPLIEADGGSIEVVEVSEDAVVVRLGGAYAGCPSTSFTLRGVVEPAIRKATGTSIEVSLAPAAPRGANATG